ncbi:response regulator transcription factor [Murimonas intestini]|uniref:Stage 0 sporulation protein A homolog n=1 Tax=Murimonas intestini TaxID=1337051 RepID=A0AB73T2L5_9FIRM|nr:response regulator transcription factor [Murimonas intestini]MCR1841735.1 response regulator transcription factor [Murimonas intestini]MCR1865552.1 response regulator transcription factor [Murimonas intestini]MCR1883867.1 response regulator transcription factor [Murimonas intestini]
MHYNCLIIDDEEPLAESTAEYFNIFGVSAAAVFDAEGCRRFLGENSADIILLDINLDKTSGFDLCRELRTKTQVPILFISARQSDDDILLALGIGGDDYIRKPYTLSVLLAKVKAVLKRCAPKEETRYQCGELEVDFLAGRAYKCKKPLKLKAMEYKLLAYLVRNRGRVIHKEELFSQVWGDVITGDGTLNVHIRRLREQIEEDPNHPVYIRTVWGTGYLFEEMQP